MIYECDQCSKPLPSGVTACPNCGESFEDVVPADAEVPRRGFSAALTRPAPSPPQPKMHSGAYDWLDAPAENKVQDNRPSGGYDWLDAPTVTTLAAGPANRVRNFKVFGFVFVGILLVCGGSLIFDVLHGDGPLTSSSANAAQSLTGSSETLQQNYESVHLGLSRADAIALVGRDPDLTYTGTVGPVLQWKDSSINVFRVMLKGDQVVGATYVSAAGGIDAAEVKGETL